VAASTQLAQSIAALSRPVGAADLGTLDPGAKYNPVLSTASQSQIFKPQYA
jgi:hypothetical protein